MNGRICAFLKHVWSESEDMDSTLDAPPPQKSLDLPTWVKLHNKSHAFHARFKGINLDRFMFAGTDLVI